MLLYSLPPRCGDVLAFLCFGVCVCLPPYPDWVDTMLSPLRSLLDVAELASQSHSLLVLLVFCFGGFFVFILLNDLAKAKRRWKEKKR